MTLAVLGQVNDLGDLFCHALCSQIRPTVGLPAAAAVVADLMRAGPPAAANQEFAAWRIAPSKLAVAAPPINQPLAAFGQDDAGNPADDDDMRVALDQLLQLAIDSGKRV